MKVVYKELSPSVKFTGGGSSQIIEDVKKITINMMGIQGAKGVKGDDSELIPTGFDPLSVINSIYQGD